MFLRSLIMLLIALFLFTEGQTGQTWTSFDDNNVFPASCYNDVHITPPVPVDLGKALINFGDEWESPLDSDAIRLGRAPQYSRYRFVDTKVNWDRWAVTPTNGKVQYAVQGRGGRLFPRFDRGQIFVYPLVDMDGDRFVDTARPITKDIQVIERISSDRQLYVADIKLPTCDCVVQVGGSNWVMVKGRRQEAVTNKG